MPEFCMCFRGLFGLECSPHLGTEVWAEALDAWLQQLAQGIVQEHTSQALTPANVQASLQLLLAKDAITDGNQVLGHDPS
ncbi:hypothetical protein WJX77_011932 [Trebouxia sp. C0004]